MNERMTEQELRKQMRETENGQLLVRAGFEPYDTESAARRVAEHAAKEIAQLRLELEDTEKDRDYYMDRASC